MNENVIAKEKINYGESKIQRYGAFVFLLAMFAANSIFTRNFFSLNTVWLLIIQSFPIIVCGLGMTLVIASGGIDISVGATMAFSGTILAALMVTEGWPLTVCILVCLASAVVIGAVNGFIIAKFRVQPIVMTLVMMLVSRGLAQVVTSGKPVPFSYMPLNTISTFRFWKQGIPMQLILALVLILLVAYIMRRTVFGKQIQAMGDNYNAARLAGINTFAVIMLVYIICAFSGGLATIIEVGRESQAEAARMGLNMEMNAIAAVAVGGTPMTGGRARVWGTVAGALIMQMVGMTINMNGMLSSWGMVAKAVILVLAVYLQSDRSKS
jgi:ribose/xylose/arabinose/galactoside ABC-type transport system permease subunit